MDGIANHFPAKNALDCMILHTMAKRTAPGALTQTQFSLGSPAFPLFRFYETTTDVARKSRP